MAYIKDLDPCDYFSFDHRGHLLAIGWLDSSHEFSIGKIDKIWFDHLRSLLANSMGFIQSTGPHRCNICQFGGEMGANNIFIPYKGDIYVAPELILHYIQCHRYMPPRIFIDAVSALDDANGMKYKKKILSNNGSFLINKLGTTRGLFLRSSP